MNFEIELADAPEKVAKRLLGSYLIRNLDGHQVVTRIVETEAYDQTDPASHSFRGPTPRTAIMFGPAGFLYVYFSYGLHHCMNIVTGPRGHGSAVLIRALEPIKGLRYIRANRHNIASDLLLTNGPGKACQSLAIGREFNGHDLGQQPLKLELKAPPKSSAVVATIRIGISRATELKWRFYLKNNPYVSKA